LYSLKVGWEKIFTQERQKLKPNDISVLKCFVLNRFLYEYLKVRILEICEFIVTHSALNSAIFIFIRIHLCEWYIKEKEYRASSTSNVNCSIDEGHLRA